MPKGDDHIRKKKTKAIRKRMRRVGGDSLEAIQGVQAAKRRRKSGTRRACEGMCYTLPTADDPYNDRNDRRRKRKENSKLRKREVPAGEILEFETYSDIANGSDVDASAGYEKQLKRRRALEDNEEEIEPGVSQNSPKRRNFEEVKDEICAGEHCCNKIPKRRSSRLAGTQVLNSGTPSPGKEREDGKEGAMDEVVLAAISEAGLLSADFSKVNFTNGDSKKGMKKQGVVLGQQCLQAFTKGVDVVAVSSLGWEDRALGYVVAAAAHIKLQRTKQAAPHEPLVLITVASQEQALQVRRICKPLKKNLAIASVCVHTGTSLEKQTKGFSLQTPDIVVATPERLVELVAHQAISLASVSFLVVDGLDDIISNGLQNYISKLKEYVLQGARKLIIGDKFSKDAVVIARQLIANPIARVISEPNFERRSACITQEVSVFTSINKRLPKMLKILQEFWEKQEKNSTWDILVLVDTAEMVKELLPTIQSIGYVAAGLTGSEDSQLELITKKLSLNTLCTSKNIEASSSEKTAIVETDALALCFYVYGCRVGSVQALVTTEEALNHVPLEKMQLVVNYSFPSTMEVYQQILTGMARYSVHGVLHSLCTASMAPLAFDLEKVLRSCLQEVPRSLQMLAEAVSLFQNGMN